MAVIRDVFGNITEVLATNITFLPLFGGRNLNIGTVKLIYETITSKKDSDPTYITSRNYYGTVDEQLYDFNKRSFTLSDGTTITGAMVLEAIRQLGDAIYNEQTHPTTPPASITAQE